MVSLQTIYSSVRSPPCPLFIHPRRRQCFHFRSRRNCANSSVYSPVDNVKLVINNVNRPEQTPRTLFPGGFKRPEIKVPGLVLKVSCEDVLRDETVVNEIDQAISGRVDVVVLSGGGASGGKLYEAACLLKSIIKGMAYLLIDGRVDIAAAVNASGVLLSDQDLPAIVARNTMMDSKSEDLVVLPLVARIVQTPAAAVDASNSEGADFLIYEVGVNSKPEELVISVFERVKIPVFVMIGSLGDRKLFNEASNLLESGASGLVISMEDLRSVSDDDFGKLFYSPSALKKKSEEKSQSNSQLNSDLGNGFPGRKGVAGFIDLRDREEKLLENERLVLCDAINVIEKAAPMMEEISLLKDAVSQLDEPFLLVIVGEFNSGKSTFINALLGKKYLKDGVVPTTNEITFLCYSDVDESQRCERHPDGQYVCYLPAPVLEEMIIVDTPGTNVILQRQQRLTEEFVPRADLLLFLMSADRPLTESEVSFLRYTQQWSKKVVFVLNKSDIYKNKGELEEAITFIKENTRKLLNTESITLYPVSARLALESKLSTFDGALSQNNGSSNNDSHWKTESFYELEKYLSSFLDSSTSTGIERMKLKLETPIAIAEQLLLACQGLVRQECQQAKQDLLFVENLVSSVEECTKKLEVDSISWKRQVLSLINSAQARVVRLVESTLQLSNVDLVATYVFRGENSTQMPATISVQNDILGQAVLEGQNLLGEYTKWLQSKRDQEVQFYKQSFEKRWTSLVNPSDQIELGTTGVLDRKSEVTISVIEDFSAAAASKLLERDIREVFLGTFGGLGAAGLSASLLTSVLQTTLEDLLALGLCSAGGLLAVSNFSSRRQQVVDKVKRTADGLARELEEAMQKELLETTSNVEDFVKLIGKPYQVRAQNRLDELLATAEELTIIEKKLKSLRIDIQNLHVS
ncbi:probable transmembrane GTPase FZO-like, chloroplastic isoform X1 [Solanum lycopersicum]|uniref:probable transmembrane GTPase FZO-like, chloroplastic isoform X1 n=2 Tax=Solanum lycopersicum TaxID=4081 RepID=UPI0002BCC233|nr:probable transmembrane GTPase FZO-like, chloroplastic isoform X1 [Solanum lycopersicum]